MHKDARIGFHAPYLELGSSQTDRQFSATEVNVAYKAALSAVTQLADLGRNRGGRDAIIPMGLIVELLRRGPNEIFYIDTVDKAGRWNIDLFGFSLSPELTRMNGARACHNLLWWNDDKSATLPAERFINVTTLDEYIISEWGWGGVELGDRPLEVREGPSGDFVHVQNYSGGFESELVCQITMQHRNSASSPDLKISLLDRPRNVAIGTRYSSEAQAGDTKITLYQGEVFPAWKTLPPDTRLSELSGAMAISNTALPSMQRSESMPQRKIMSMYDIAYKYGGESSHTVGGLDECVHSCRTSNECNAFTFFEDRRLCRLMTAPAEKRSHRGAISGYKVH